MTVKMYDSLMIAKDSEVIPILLEVHAADDPLILDCTYNRGTMWKGIRERYRIVTMDIDPKYQTDYVGDFRAMPFADSSFDVIVFDPPHLPTAAATDGSSNIWRERYGITAEKGMGRDGDNVSELFLPFLKEAARVLRPNGVVLAKIADLVHNHRYQWQHVDFINAAKSVDGLTPCDLLIKRDPAAGRLKSSKWKTPKHLRKCHCYWIVVRKSRRCEK